MPPCWPPHANQPAENHEASRRAFLKTVRQRNPKVSLSSRWNHPKMTPEPFTAYTSNQTLKGARLSCPQSTRERAPSRRAASPRQHEVDGGGSQTRACNHSHLAYPHPLQRRGLFVCRASPPHWPKPMNPLPFCARLGAFESSTSQHSLRATGWSPPKP